jgi:nucleoside-diphosphate-sugar epimerase
MNVLITGSTGGIGQWVVKRLLEAGHTICAMDIKAQPRHPDYEYIPGDVRDLTILRRAVYGMDAVVHLAAIPYDMERQEDLLLDTNLHGTANVLLACEEAGVQRLVYFSSINALGQAEPGHPGLYLPLDDDVPPYTIRNYALSKNLCEQMCQAFASRGDTPSGGPFSARRSAAGGSNLTAISLRPTLVTHPGPSRFHWWEFLPDEIKLQANQGDFWSYVDVRDVAEATLLSLTAQVERHQALLLTADDNRTHTPSAELVEKYYSHLPWPKISKEEYLGRGEFISLVDCSAAKRLLGWQPKYSRFDSE